MPPAVHILDPLADTRWDELLERHPRASVFHSRGWLEALRRTYGYEPIVLTTSGPGPLENGLLVCRVETWRSRRLMSLPFSDHCEPLVGASDDFSALLACLVDLMKKEHWRSLELRPRFLVPVGLRTSAGYCLHTLDLTKPAERIFDEFHHSCTRRAIRRAEREGLTYESGTSERMLSAFYELLRLTRRRHGLPPQPLAWFRNLAACVTSGLSIHLARKNGLPVAGILTLLFKNTVVYKYGGSDARYHRLGGVPFLFWRAIQAAKAQGAEEMDLGRSALSQPGLIAFKSHLGAVQSPLTYHTWPEHRRHSMHDSPAARAALRVVSHLPDAVFDLSGRLLYKYLG